MFNTHLHSVLSSSQAVICCIEWGEVALKLGRDEVRWAWSPCSPGKEGWNAAVGGGQGTVPGKQEVSSTEVYSDNSTEVVSLVDYKM